MLSSHVSGGKGTGSSSGTTGIGKVTTSPRLNELLETASAAEAQARVAKNVFICNCRVSATSA